MGRALFDFFESIAEELSSEQSRVITREDLQEKDEESELFDELRREMKASSNEEVFRLAVNALENHFKAKSSHLPFSYDHTIGRFTTIDQEFLSFIKTMHSIRSLGKKARDFECGVAERLSRRTTGAIHRVGHPRDKKKLTPAFNAHMRTLGFSRPVLLDREKDGGFDILWLLPIGTIPHRPFVSVQCKNASFDLDAAGPSLGAGSRSLSQHDGLQPSVHVPCVLFNDYIHPGLCPRKPLEFVPLGLSDLATLGPRISAEFI